MLLEVSLFTSFFSLPRVSLKGSESSRVPEDRRFCHLKNLYARKINCIKKALKTVTISFENIIFCLMRSLADAIDLSDLEQLWCDEKHWLSTCPFL